MFVVRGSVAARLIGALACLAWCLAPVPTNAAVVVLDFEGLGNFDTIQEFYNGGTSPQGNTGPDFDISFDGALTLIDSEAGGNGNFANEPSPSTAVLDPFIMNVPNGFTTTLSFQFSAVLAGPVNIFDALDGGGNIISSVTLLPQFDNNNCVGDPTGQLCFWTAVNMNFAGTAFSASFGDENSRILFDDITLETTLVPEPSSLAIFAAALSGIGFVMWRRRNVGHRRVAV